MFSNLRVACSALLVLGAACGGGSAGAAGGARGAAASEGACEASWRPLEFVENDVDGASRRARAEGKLLFVDAWAPWCHTCLSMKNFVFSTTEAQLLACDVVPVALDTDRPESAAFVERYGVTVWPTFFLIDPASGEVVGRRAGAASVRELRDFVDLGREAQRDTTRAVDPTTAKGVTAEVALRAAQRDLALGESVRAVKWFDRYFARAPLFAREWSAAALGALEARKQSGDFAACAAFGADFVPAVKGSALPADFAAQTLACAKKLPAGDVARIRAENKALARLVELTTDPHEDATADDRADAWAILAEAYAARGDAELARDAHASRLAILERAAAEAGPPAKAETYDGPRLEAYLALGAHDRAIALLERRSRELPTSYAAPGRLAAALLAAGQPAEARAAAQRAIDLAYGPRKARYLKLRAEIEGALGERALQTATLRELVALHERMPGGQRDVTRLEEARALLAAAEKSMAEGPTGAPRAQAKSTGEAPPAPARTPAKRKRKAAPAR